MGPTANVRTYVVQRLVVQLLYFIFFYFLSLCYRFSPTSHDLTMLASLFTAALALAAPVLAAEAPAGGLVLQNTTAAGSVITWPSDNATST